MSCRGCPLMYVMIQPNYYPSMHVVPCMSCYNPKGILPCMSCHACRQKEIVSCMSCVNPINVVPCMSCHARRQLRSYHVCRVLHVLPEPNNYRVLHVVACFKYYRGMYTTRCISCHVCRGMPQYYRDMYVVRCISCTLKVKLQNWLVWYLQNTIYSPLVVVSLSRTHYRNPPLVSRSSLLHLPRLKVLDLLVVRSTPHLRFRNHSAHFASEPRTCV